jgi:ribosome assembly protein YihI (activator of Der GTPase)
MKNNNRRQKIFDRYFKGFEEYKKSEYFRDKAAIAEQTASKKQLNDPVYLDNRIKECINTIKKIEESIFLYEEILNKIKSSFYNNKTAEQVQKWINESLDKIEWYMDKQAFFENCMEEIKVKREEIGRL